MLYKTTTSSVWWPAAVLLLYSAFTLPVQAVNATIANTTITTTSTGTSPSSVVVENATNTIDFSAAVQLASSVQWQIKQLETIPAVPVPSNITGIQGYDIVSKIAPALPIIQAGIELPGTDRMVSDLIAWSNISSTGDSLVGRQSALRVMIVGDSMTQGQQGDYTWRYRIWQWFQQNKIAVKFVGPYVGTVPPSTASPPTPPTLYGTTPATTSSGTNGGYAANVDSSFLSNCNHFSVWGRAAAVDKGLIAGMLQQSPADMMLLMLGFNDMGWFYSDAPGTIESIGTLISNARSVNPNMKFAVANVPQRSFIGGREDLVENTNIYNNLLPKYISQWTTSQSPVYIVPLEQTYVCQPGGCPAGYDGLHPNAWGEFQIANAFSQTLVNNFKMGSAPLSIPAQSDASLVRSLPVPSNFKVFTSPQGVSATWDAVYGAYSYDLTVSINGGANTFSPTTTGSNRWDCQWPVDGWTYAVSVRASAGDTRKGSYTSVQSAVAHPQLASPPTNVVVTPTNDGFKVTWDPPTGPYTDSIIEYNVIYWDSKPTDCQFITGAAFKSSPAVITGLNPGVSYLIAPLTWNANGQGVPTFGQNAVPGAGTPAIPGIPTVITIDPTSVHITWPAVNGAGGYHLWSRNINQAGSKWVLVTNVTDSTCNDEYILYPGVWNYAWALSAFNGNLESPMGPSSVAPSPASTVTAGSPGPTCPAAQPWCPGGGSGSIPSGSMPTATGGSGGGGGGGSGTSPGGPTSITVVGGKTSIIGGTTTVISGRTTVVGGKTTVSNGITETIIGPGVSTTVVGGSTTVVKGTTTVISGHTTIVGGSTSVVGGTTSTVSGTSGTTIVPVPTNTAYPIVTNGQCTGPDCQHAQCVGSLCAAFGCVGSDCHNGVCFGLNCIPIGCIGPFCYNGLCEGFGCLNFGCIGPGCSNGICKSWNCLGLNCAGPACGDNGICEGPNCSEVTCSGPDCHNGGCVGPSCVDYGTDVGGGDDAPEDNPNDEDDDDNCSTTLRTATSCAVKCYTAPTSTCYTDCATTSGCSVTGTTSTTTVASNAYLVPSPYYDTLADTQDQFVLSVASAAMAAEASLDSSTASPGSTASPTSTLTPTPTSTQPPFPTNSGSGGTKAYCYLSRDHFAYSADDQAAVVDGLCRTGNTVTPGQTFSYVSGGKNAAGHELTAQVGWAKDQSGCQTEKTYKLSVDACQAAFQVVSAACAADPGTQYGGGWVDNDQFGCLLFEIGAAFADQ